MDAQELVADFSTAESNLASYIPGGYSPSRCMKLSGMPMVYAIYAYAGCAIMFFGYDTAVMSQVNINPDYLRTMGVAGGTDRDAAAIGGLVSLWFGGFAIAGAMMVGYTADRVGRLKTIQFGCIWGILGAVLLATAQNISWFACARVISGIGCGYLNTIVPVWTSELAPANMRGAFVAVQFTLAMVGSALVYWLEYACVKTRSLSFAWRFPNAFQIIFLLVLLAFGPFYPESPRYLAKIGKIDHAKSILQKCRIDPNEENIDNEMEEILDAIRLEASDSNPSFYNMLFTSDKLHTRRRVFLGAGVQIMQKFTGIDFIAANKFGAGVAAILYVYTFIYGSTWLTTCWVYPTEVFPLATRSKGTAIATFAFSVAGGTINMIIPYLISAIGFWVFILFALINLVMLVPIYLFYIETANRHLEDLDLLFASKSSFVWRAEQEFADAKRPQGASHDATN
ncbi:uncharacterized protein TERG_07230 [Trichophyton rubrum CBS 118892]|uniref:Major facilitator superfamily (MFS) profile domain-containing protein n=1 Tax=Trichophyton rubrum (strain ATCC MYA-4607 / CBS 118892) TaxID=559305 RepID=F2SXD5_TRIRC|nr:uncharacterized protein TERG_07230 [Trichophyton rubrum CBS 118892]EGD91007.2 hypothetical protein TERG_07230 [Trichophyton rubrum CBS 118892]